MSNEMISATNVRPYHMFKQDVVRDLQKVPFGWVGAAGYQLAARYESIINANWLAHIEVRDTAFTIHNRYMKDTAPKAVALPTRESMKRVGCKFYGPK